MVTAADSVVMAHIALHRMVTASVAITITLYLATVMATAATATHLAFVRNTADMDGVADAVPVDVVSVVEVEVASTCDQVTSPLAFAKNQIDPTDGSN